MSPQPIRPTASPPSAPAMAQIAACSARQRSCIRLDPPARVLRRWDDQAVPLPDGRILAGAHEDVGVPRMTRAQLQAPRQTEHGLSDPGHPAGGNDRGYGWERSHPEILPVTWGHTKTVI